MTTPNASFATGGDFDPRANFYVFADMLVFHNKRKETLLASSDYKGQDRDAANHPSMDRATSMTRN